MPAIHARFGRYVVVSSAAQMPAKVKARYRRVAVIDTFVPDVEPTLIRDCARWSVIYTWERLNVGLAVTSAYRKALDEATETARKMFYGR